MKKYIFAVIILLIVSGFTIKIVLADQYTDNAIGYLISKQESSGKISGFGGESDWASIAFAAKKQGNSKLKDFLKADKIASTSAATDIERRILAISAMNEDVKNFGGINYLRYLEDKFNENQIGDINLVNDDIFGLLALIAGKSDLVVQKQAALDFVISKQNADGGFSWSANPPFNMSDSNDTASAIQSLKAAKENGINNESLDNAISKAKDYLIKTQNSDGGFGYDESSDSDGSSTAWGLMALNVLNIGDSGEATNARNYLISLQKNDGGFPWMGSFDPDTYTTSHAIIGLSGQGWLLNVPEIPLPSSSPAASTTGPSLNVSPTPTPTPSTSAVASVSSPSPSISPSPSPSPSSSPSASVNPQVPNIKTTFLSPPPTIYPEILGESSSPSQPKKTPGQPKQESTVLVKALKGFVIPVSGLIGLGGIFIMLWRKYR